MKKLSIIKYPNPVLEQKAKRIKDPLDPEVQELIQQMWKTMKESDGMGLAANQIGVPVRLCIVEDIENSKLYTAINPTITSYSKKQIALEEGCLSFPGKFLIISRPEKIQVRFTDSEGKKTKLKASGMLARAFQHEIDHLMGIVFIKRINK